MGRSSKIKVVMCLFEKKKIRPTNYLGRKNGQFRFAKSGQFKIIIQALSNISNIAIDLQDTLIYNNEGIYFFFPNFAVIDTGTFIFRTLRLHKSVKEMTVLLRNLGLILMGSFFTSVPNRQL